MSLARAIKRNARKARNEGATKVAKRERRASQSVKLAYVEQMKYDREVRSESLEKLSAIFLYAMHEKYQFGASRLSRLRNKMQSEFDSIVHGNVSVEQIAEFLNSDIGLHCGVNQNKGATHHRQIEFKAVREMSAAFLMALLDEFGFKKKRLGTAYTHCADLSVRLDKNEITYSEIKTKIKNIFEGR